MDMSNSTLDIIKNETLTFTQKVVSLAQDAENSISPIKLSDKEKKIINNGAICTMYEGNAPYRPRYIIVDFEKFFKNGSRFLDLNPPENIWEATNSLLILYRHIPSITTMPVYIGNIDKLLDRFITDEDEATKAIRLFLLHIDKTITDSFCHANIGPEYTKAGEIIVKLARELNTPTPNITLKYNSKTTRSLAIEAIKTALETAKPSFANDDIFRNDFDGDYAIASCYNGLHIGGGSHTLVRLVLNKIAEKSKSINDFLNNKLPKAVKRITSIMDKRINFIVEQSNFFDSSFLVKEKLIDISKFTAMLGIVGLAECVNYLMEKEGTPEKRFGNNKKADKLGLKIIQKLEKLVNYHKAPYCNGSNNKYILHAQVGISSDRGISPGCRIPIGEEPMIYDHILQSSPFHKYFPSGIGDIFVFDTTYKNNPEAIH